MSGVSRALFFLSRNFTYYRTGIGTYTKGDPLAHHLHRHTLPKRPAFIS